MNREDFFHGMNQIEGEISKCEDGDVDLVMLEVKDDEDTKKTFYVPKIFYDLLKEHQKQSLSWLVTQLVQRRGSILADEMGLGKTISAISLLVAYYVTMKMAKAPSGPTLIVCPATIIN